MEKEILVEVELKARNGLSEIRVLEIKVASGRFQKIFICKRRKISRLSSSSRFNDRSLFVITDCLACVFLGKCPILDKYDFICFGKLYLHFILLTIKSLNLRPRKARRSEKLLCRAKSHSIVTRRRVSLSCPTTPHPS